MIVVYCLISLWLGAVVGYAAFRSRPAVLRMEPEDTRDAGQRHIHMSLYLVARKLNSRRPVAWWLRRAWPVYRNMKWGMTRGPFTVVYMEEDIDIDTHEIVGDPCGKIEAAAERLATRLLACKQIGGFVWDEVFHGLDFCHSFTDHETGVCLRLFRGYDLHNNCFVTKLTTKVLV